MKLGGRIVWAAASWLLLVMAEAPAQDWPRFRGVNGSGVNPAATLPVKWTEADYRWKADLPGVGQGSPVVWGGKVFLLSGDEQSGERRVMCLDAATGKTVWEKRYASQTYRMHRFNTYASSTAAVDEQHVYVPWGSPEKITVKAFTHEGKEAWEADLGPFRGGHGFGVSPIVHEDLLILTNEQEKGPSSLIALDRKTGKKRWETPRDTGRGTYSTPTVYRPGDGPAQLVLTNWELGMTGIDPANGKVLWENRKVFGTKEERAIGSPITSGELVVATCGFTARPRNLVVMNPSKATGGAVEPLWKKTESWVPHIPTPLVVGEQLYLWADNGIVTCLKLRTGEQVFQKRVADAPGNFFSSPVSDGKHVFNVTEYGDVVAIKVGGKYEQVAVNKLDAVMRSSPAIANGDLLIRTHHRLYCIRGAK